MKEQALELAKEFDEMAEMNFDMVLRSENDSPVGQQLSGLHIKFAKDYQRNAQLLRDMVAEIERLENANKNT
jgi:hypothetical protein